MNQPADRVKHTFKEEKKTKEVSDAQGHIYNMMNAMVVDDQAEVDGYMNMFLAEYKKERKPEDFEYLLKAFAMFNPEKLATLNGLITIMERSSMTEELVKIRAQMKGE